MTNTTITIVGNATREPEVRFTSSGLATVSFSVAVNRKVPGRNGEPGTEAVSFFNVVAYGSLAENVSQSVNKGTRVIATGRLDQRTWESATGDRRTTYELVADEVGTALRWASVKVEKPERLYPTQSEMREAVEAAPLIPASQEVASHAVSQSEPAFSEPAFSEPAFSEPACREQASEPAF
jgi:single-strand DNA-binding protein